LARELRRRSSLTDAELDALEKIVLKIGGGASDGAGGMPTKDRRRGCYDNEPNPRPRVRIVLPSAAAADGLELKAHPHMLRHACGYALANKGHDARPIQGWLGHRSITSTAVYTALAPNRFKDFWRD
jgi:integrase